MPSEGLSSAQARQRLAELGPNALPEPKRRGFVLRLLDQFRSALVYLLLLALAVDALAWAHAGARGVPIEALAVGAVLLLNAGLGLLQGYRSEQALSLLRKLGSARAWALRDGAFTLVDVAALTVGDRVRLEAGDRVPADGTVQAATRIRVDESMLTGESIAVEKGDGDELFSGSLVLDSGAELSVTRTGQASAMGRLARALTGIQTAKTPLERSMDDLGSRVARYVAALTVVIVVAGLAVEGLAHFDRILMFAVAFAVAVVPEGMPAVVTLVLSLGVQRMAARHAAVRRLSGVEALGAVTVIASDKTGTLTCNQLSVGSLDAAASEEEALLALALANDADHGSGAGDPLERGLLEFLMARGSDVEMLRSAYPRVSSRPFDSSWKCMRATVATHSGEWRSYLKGAAEVIIERSLLGEAERSAWLEKVDRESASGFKVLGLASGTGNTETELTFLGLVMLRDAPRKEAKASVQEAHAAGIKVLMLTGDHPGTALAIAQDIGIPSARTLSGDEVQRMPALELSQALLGVRVFSRLSPQQKLRIVEALQARGEVVAVTGDGLNDALALKRADVAVAMGQRGSDVAREVSDLVLLDDDFSTIVAAVEEGRVIYENLLSFVRFTFSSNVALALLVLGGAAGAILLDLRGAHGALLLPLTALQILWINFLGDGLTALALSMDRSRGTMQQRPRPRDRSLLDAQTWRFVLLDGGFKGAVGLLLLLILPHFGASLAATGSGIFLYESVAKLVSVYPARKIGGTLAANAWLHVSVAAGVGLGVACVALPALRGVLLLSPLAPRELAIVASALLLTWLSGELSVRVVQRVNQPG